MYGDFAEYTERPPIKIVKSYTDTADEGKDYLCSIVYAVPQRGDFLYVLDVVFNQKAMEITEPQVAEMLEANESRENKIESNNGGRGFARNVDKLTTNKINVKWFCQSKNKQSRIFSNSASVTRTIVMPIGWATRWPEFYSSLSNHKKDAKNKHDDAADCITGVYESEYVKPKKAGITTY
jgi:predicted phage terminase large subunit-like protein